MTAAAAQEEPTPAAAPAAALQPTLKAALPERAGALGWVAPERQAATPPAAAAGGRAEPIASYASWSLAPIRVPVGAVEALAAAVARRHREGSRAERHS